MGCLGAIVIVLIMLLIVSLFQSYPVIMWSLVIAIIGFLIYYIPKNSKEQKEKEREELEKQSKYKMKYNIPSDAVTAYCKDGSSIGEHINYKNLLVWKENRSLNFVSKEYKEDFGIYRVLIDDIIFYSRQGDFYTKTETSGGGSSVGGAIAGAVIAGEAGAIVGSRKEMKTETQIVDNRQTILAIKNDKEEKYLFFNSQSYDVFLKIIPQKEFNITYKQRSDPNSNDKEDVYYKIEKLSDLKEKCIITDEEFNDKKKKLLEQI